MTRKSKFKEPSKAVILSRKDIDYIAREDLAARLVRPVSPDNGFIVQGNFGKGFSSDRKFRKHAPAIQLASTNLTKGQMIAATARFDRNPVLRDRSLPLFMRERAISMQLDPENPPSGFLVYPLLDWKDRIPRKIPLYHVVDGHRIFAEEGVRVVPYADAAKVAREGAEVIMTVPSMTEGVNDYEFVSRHEPVLRNGNMALIGTGITTTHQCGDKQFNNMKYGKPDEDKSSKDIIVCKHEVAGRLGLIEFYYCPAEGWNYVPLQNSFVPLLSRRFAQGAARALDSVLVEDESAKEGARRPRAGELEEMYWLMVDQLGPSEALYSHVGRDGKVKNYDWGMRE
jgi:hypothetical protein